MANNSRVYQSNPDPLYRTLGGRRYLLRQGVLSSKAGEPFYAPHARKSAPYWPHASLSVPEVAAGHGVIAGHLHAGDVHPVSDGHSPLVDHPRFRPPPQRYTHPMSHSSLDGTFMVTGAHHMKR